MSFLIKNLHYFTKHLLVKIQRSYIKEDDMSLIEYLKNHIIEINNRKGDSTFPVLR